MIKKILIIFFGFILICSLNSKVIEGYADKSSCSNKDSCSKCDRECAKTVLYKVEQSDKVLKEKIKNTKSFINGRINDVKNLLKDLVKKQNDNKTKTTKNKSSIQSIKEEL